MNAILEQEHDDGFSPSPDNAYLKYPQPVPGPWSAQTLNIFYQFQPEPDPDSQESAPSAAELPAVPGGQQTNAERPSVQQDSLLASARSSSAAQEGKQQASAALQPVQADSQPDPWSALRASSASMPPTVQEEEPQVAADVISGKDGSQPDPWSALRVSSAPSAPAESGRLPSATEEEPQLVLKRSPTQVDSPLFTSDLPPPPEKEEPLASGEPSGLQPEQGNNPLARMSELSPSSEQPERAEQLAQGETPRPAAKTDSRLASWLKSQASVLSVSELSPASAQEEKEPPASQSPSAPADKAPFASTLLPPEKKEDRGPGEPPPAKTDSRLAAWLKPQVPVAPDSELPPSVSEEKKPPTLSVPPATKTGASSLTSSALSRPEEKGPPLPRASLFPEQPKSRSEPLPESRVPAPSLAAGLPPMPKEKPKASPLPPPPAPPEKPTPPSGSPLRFSLDFPESALPSPGDDEPQDAAISQSAQTPSQLSLLLSCADEMAICRAGLQRQLGVFRVILDELSQTGNAAPQVHAKLKALADQCGRWLQRQLCADQQLRRRLRREAGGGGEVTSTSLLGRLPTLAEVVLIRLGDDSFAVPLVAIRGVGRLPHAACAAGGVYRHGGKDYRLFDLWKTMGFSPVRADGLPQVPLLLLEAGGVRVAIAVDSIDGRYEVLIESIASGIVTASTRWLAGAALFEDGRGVGVLDIDRLLEELADEGGQGAANSDARAVGE